MLRAVLPPVEQHRDRSVDAPLPIPAQVDTTTAVTRWAADPAFARAVRSSMPCFRFNPARRDGRAVPVIVVQSFWFDIVQAKDGPTGRAIVPASELGRSPNR